MRRGASSRIIAQPHRPSVGIIVKHAPVALIVQLRSSKHVCSNAPLTMCMPPQHCAPIGGPPPHKATKEKKLRVRGVLVSPRLTAGHPVLVGVRGVHLLGEELLDRPSKRNQTREVAQESSREEMRACMPSVLQSVASAHAGFDGTERGCPRSGGASAASQRN
jgi:hypothetical protein